MITSRPRVRSAYPLRLRRALASLAPLTVSLLAAHNASGQGCVAVRQMSTCSLDHHGLHSDESHWQIDTAFRWFQSDRHFRGIHEEPERQEQNTEVINDSSSLDLTITYLPDSRNSFSVTLPYLYNERSSLYEHDRVNRHTMRSKGLGDVRFTAARWLFAPSTDRKSNVLLGFGIKAPTGDHRAQDIAYTPNGPELRNVDQSIQLGDGGWGASLQLQAFRNLSDRLSVYGDGFYLMNPRNTNGVDTHRRRQNESVMSVADQYMVRAGASYALSSDGNVTAQLGGRVEGVPVSDFIGDSDGFRRPGYAVSIEPGITYRKGDHAFSLSLPVVVHRNRQRSLQDMENNSHGDAAFADYLFFASYSRRL